MTTDDKALEAIGRAAVEKATTACWRAGCDEKDGVGRIHKILMNLVSDLIERGVLLTPEQAEAAIQKLLAHLDSRLICGHVARLQTEEIDATIGAKVCLGCRAEARVKAAKEMAEANIRDIEEQSNLEKQAAVAAALERAAQHYLTTDPESALAYCACGIDFNYGTCNREWGEHVRSLANTDALREVKAQARLEEARDSVNIS